MATLFLLVGYHSAISEGKNGESMSQDVFETNLATVQHMHSERNVDALGGFAHRLEKEWTTADAPRRAELLLEIIRSIETLDRREGSTAALGLAITALEHADEFPIEIEIKLLRHVRPTRSRADDQSSHVDWPNERKRAALLWFHAWRRYHIELDESFDPADMPPTRNVSPPQGTRLPSGSDPKSVKDPALRAKYEEAIKANKAKADLYNKQDALRMVRRKFFRDIERFIVEAYSAPPDDRQELRQMVLDFAGRDRGRLDVIAAIDANWDK